MPLYEYECEQCGDLFEVMQKFSDEPITTHQKCGGKVHRLLSAPALQFKGSGWYITDYAKAGNSTANGAKKTESSEAKPSTGSDKTTAASKSSDSGSSSKSTSAESK